MLHKLIINIYNSIISIFMCDLKKVFVIVFCCCCELNLFYDYFYVGMNNLICNLHWVINGNLSDYQCSYVLLQHSLKFHIIRKWVFICCEMRLCSLFNKEMDNE